VIEVTNLYTRYLRRDPDPGGLALFTAFLANGGTVEQVAEMLTASPEYFENAGGGTNAGFLDALYSDALDRSVDPFGQAVFDQAMDQGVSRAAIVTAVFTSSEFEQGLVDGLYETYLHRPADDAGLSAFAAYLSQGGREENVIAALVGSAEYAQSLDGVEA
jgi:hypothetical protein